VNVNSCDGAEDPRQLAGQVRAGGLVLDV